MRGITQAADVRELRGRLQFVIILAGITFLALVARLFQLQVLETEHHARRAEDNFTQTIDVEAPRGRIFDARGKPLATSRPAYAIYVVARPRILVPDPTTGDLRAQREPISDSQIAELAQLVDFVDDADRQRLLGAIDRLRHDEQNGRYAVKVRDNLAWEENARIQTRESLRGWVEIRESARRHYPAGELTAFVTGHMREIGEERLSSAPHGEYRPGDRVGQTGIERLWENYLRGRLGSRSRVVNARGHEVTDPPPDALAVLPADHDPIPGQDIYLSIDAELQRIGSEGFEGNRAGGLVAMEVQTGRILAMVSIPSIDPNRWEQPISQAEYEGWLESPFKPFVDKTVQEMYYPGSTYKVISALAVLEDPGFDPAEEIECKGYVDYGNRRFKDTHRHGVVNLEQAIIQSCNVYFYHLAVDKNLNLNKMEVVARKLGLGERTGLGINAEVRGVVPTEASEARQGTFQRGVRLNSAIGQGNVKATVLQIAGLYAAIANGGRLVTPSLVDRIITHEGKLVLQHQATARTSTPVIAEFDRARIHRGLVGVVNDPLGTAYSERLPTVRVAGKTGTAEVGIERRQDDKQEIDGWDPTQDHAWFAGYAPAEDPAVVVVALVAHGGAGADAAAPIVMKVIDHYLGGRGQIGPRPRPPGVPPDLPGQTNDVQEERRR